ncbi:unnamed protein product [Didymodactylos carnosus]|uniref:DUF8206 domain-containing protein n=1 Tax=Didymodactylos carnosus TaxID=1234261 RepID=A0A814JK11_9BILA|nr:unnamed protein product [Didymodactylos carnosus]CAF3808567.1 unnamed protein product [Didymodactylos carnosus]
MMNSVNSSTDDMIILLLGETGVGKSTFINALVNYFTYEKLDDAIDGHMISVIPSSFVMTDPETFEQTKIKIGEDLNEMDRPGQSATQSCRCYVFPIGNRKLKIIDTPGVGDTRGIDEDKKNFKNILSFIGHYEHINGICMLLKPNESRLNIFFRFCIKELLTHLHRSAKDNIIFCFTNARSTFYSPGNTAPLLKQLLTELKQTTNVDVPFSKDNTFCFDNEAFRFVAAIKNNIPFTDEQKEDFRKSWDTSVKEASNLIIRINKCQPHHVKDTISLNEARRLIVELTRPIAEITQNIQLNIKVAEDKKRELINAEISISDLNKKLKIPAVDLKSTSLSYPRTVCTSTSCVKFVKFGNIDKINYVTHCHEHCYLQGVAQDVVNNAALQKCSAMNSANQCTKCSCGYEKHMHITYETEQINTEVIDTSVQRNIGSQQDAAGAIRNFQNKLQQRITDLKTEQQKITEVCAKLSIFLYANSITPYNDDLIEYVNHLLREEKDKRAYGSNNQDVINGLQTMVNAYEKEIKIYKDTLASVNSTQRNLRVPNVADIQPMIESLYNLPIRGAELRQQISLIRRGHDTTVNGFEKMYEPPKNRTLISKFKHLFT